MRFSTQLTFSLIVVSSAATATAALFLLNAYQQSTLNHVLNQEKSTTLNSGRTLERLIEQTKELDGDRFAQGTFPEGVLLIVEPCRIKPPPQIVVAPKHQSEFNRLELKPELWLSAALKAGVCPKSEPVEDSQPGMFFLDQTPTLPYPTFTVADSHRVAVLALPETSGAPSSLQLIVDEQGELVWSLDSREATQEALEKAGVTRSQLGAWTSEAHKKPQVKTFEHAPHALIAGMPLRVSPELFKTSTSQRRLALYSISHRSAVFYPILQLWLRAIPLGLSLLALCFLAGRLFGRSLLRPLESLIEKSKKISTGDFNAPFEKSTQDEFGLVQQAFNQMMERIRGLLKAAHDNAIMENELKLANQVQKLLFPPHDLRLAGFQIASHFETATYCGGDLWGYLEVPRQDAPPLLLLFIGDVEGHGAAPALVTAGVRGAIAMLESWLRVQPELADNPARINEYLNDAVYACTKGSMLMTFCTLVMDATHQRVVYSNAGHCKPYILNKDPGTGRYTVKMISKPGVPFGSAQGTKYDVNQEEVFTDDSIMVIYSDGLVEAKGAHDSNFNRRDLRKLLSRMPGDGARHFLDELISKRNAALNNAPIPEDDVTVIVCRMPQVGKGAHQPVSQGQRVRL
jgi:serine phosphatase RsbU (regulator of sigma subunit)